MKFKSLIEQITIEFIDHWNNHDMEKLSTFLSTDISVSSPNIVKLFPEEIESKLYGKAKVMEYWKKLNAEYHVVMKLIVLSKTDKVIKCEVDIGSEHSTLYATFMIDEYGKFINMVIEYS